MYTYDENWSEDDIFTAAEQLEGIRLGDLDTTGRLSRKANKGRVGNMIQEEFFGIPANSLREADFNYHNIELKVTPIMKKKGDYSSKERLVLGMINYGNDYKIPFKESLPMKKTRRMLLIFYLHEPGKTYEDFKIIKTTDFKFDTEDYEQVKEDYHSIINKIKEGDAHNISERQQKLLAACTKGQGKGKDFVSQPFSEIPAKSRAYSYKSGYMTAFFKKITSPERVKHLTIDKDSSFLDTVKKTLQQYIGKTDKEIRALVDCQSSEKAKEYKYRLISNMFEVNGSKSNNINQTEEFLKEGYSIKTVKNNNFGSDNQDMSFPNLDFTELSYDPFEESTWSAYFAETKYILAYWDETEKGVYTFKKFKLWEPSSEIITHAENFYEHIQSLIQNNQLKVNIKYTKSGNEIWRDNIPGKNTYGPFQVRPKGTKNSSITTIPLTNQKIKKKALYINKEYIRELLEI